jgi:hypothetical protein
MARLAEASEDKDSKAFKFAIDTLRASPGKSMPQISTIFTTAEALDDGLPYQDFHIRRRRTIAVGYGCELDPTG